MAQMLAKQASSDEDPRPMSEQNILDMCTCTRIHMSVYVNPAFIKQQLVVEGIYRVE